jgi:hypothetical protein
MRKIFAIGALLLSSAAIMVRPAAANDRNTYVNNQNYSHGYSAPAPAVSSYNHGDFDRQQVRVDQRLCEARLERDARHDVRHARSLRDGR